MNPNSTPPMRNIPISRYRFVDGQPGREMELITYLCHFLSAQSISTAFINSLDDRNTDSEVEGIGLNSMAPWASDHAHLFLVKGFTWDMVLPFHIRAEEWGGEGRGGGEGRKGFRSSLE